VKDQARNHKNKSPQVAENFFRRVGGTAEGLHEKKNIARHKKEKKNDAKKIKRQKGRQNVWGGEPGGVR